LDFENFENWSLFGIWKLKIGIFSRGARGVTKRLLVDCLTKTQVRAKPQGKVYGLRPGQRRKVKLPPSFRGGQAPTSARSNYNCDIVAKSIVR